MKPDDVVFILVRDVWRKGRKNRQRERLYYRFEYPHWQPVRGLARRWPSAQRASMAKAINELTDPEMQDARILKLRCKARG